MVRFEINGALDYILRWCWYNGIVPNIKYIINGISLIYKKNCTFVQLLSQILCKTKLRITLFFSIISFLRNVFVQHTYFIYGGLTKGFHIQQLSFQEQKAFLLQIHQVGWACQFDRIVNRLIHYDNFILGMITLSFSFLKSHDLRSFFFNVLSPEGTFRNINKLNINISQQSAKALSC